MSEDSFGLRMNELIPIPVLALFTLEALAAFKSKDSIGLRINELIPIPVLVA